MKKCFESKLHKVAIAVNVFGWSLVGFMLLVLGTISHMQEPKFGFITVFTWSLGLVTLIYGACFVSYLTMEYELTESGITIRYAKLFRETYPWSTIKQVVICYTHRSSIGLENKVIMCVTKRCRREYSPSTYRYHNWEYHLFRRHTFLPVEYSDTRLCEFQRFYRNQIQDYTKDMS